METIGTVLLIMVFGFIGVPAVAVAVIRCYFLFQYEEYRDHMIGDSRPYSWLRFATFLGVGHHAPDECRRVSFSDLTTARLLGFGCAVLYLFALLPRAAWMIESI